MTTNQCHFIGFYTTVWKIYSGQLIVNLYCTINFCCIIKGEKCNIACHSFQCAPCATTRHSCQSSIHSYWLSCHTRELNDKHSHIRLLNVSLRAGDRPPGLKTFKKQTRTCKLALIQQTPRTQWLIFWESCAIWLASRRWKPSVHQCDKQLQRELTMNLVLGKAKQTNKGLGTLSGFFPPTGLRLCATRAC